MQAVVVDWSDLRSFIERRPPAWSKTMAGLLFLLACLTLLIGASQGRAAYRQVDAKIPMQFRDRRVIGYAFQSYVWTPSVAALARRQYLRSLALTALGLALMGGAVTLLGQPEGAVLFGVASFAGAAITSRLWIKYRNLL
jgi:hypothetical protein